MKQFLTLIGSSCSLICTGRNRLFSDKAFTVQHPKNNEAIEAAKRQEGDNE